MIALVFLRKRLPDSASSSWAVWSRRPIESVDAGSAALMDDVWLGFGVARPEFGFELTKLLVKRVVSKKQIEEIIY